jgi:Cucumopine synthase C-terminal helical bundle domain
MSEIEIEWVQLGAKVTAVLTDDKNPHLANLLWASLPYRSLQNHALVSGLHLYHLVPVEELIYTRAAVKENRTQSPDGTVFLSHLQHLAVKYGPLSEYLPAAAVGYVLPEHMDTLREAGRGCWEAAYRNKQMVEVRVVRKGEQAVGELPLPRPRAVADPLLRTLVEDIHAETERIWTNPPREIVDIHAGRIASGAGSYGQYFSTMVFVNGETRPLGYDALNGLVKLARSGDVPLEALRRITPVFLSVPAEFLGYCGLKTMWSLTSRVLAGVQTVESTKDYAAVISVLALYVNCLNTWNLHYFPWQHGEQYPHSQYESTLIREHVPA